MPISAAERRFILDQLGQRAKEDLVRLWDAANRFDDVDFFRYIADTFPDLAIGYNQIAAEYAASWFEFDFPDIRANAATADAPVIEQLRKSAEWALGADGVTALDRMNGTMQRAIYDGDRRTTVINAQSNKLRWIRQARPGACAFCRMLATRTTTLGVDSTYRSEESALGVTGRSVNLSVGDRRAIASGQMTREQALARRDEMQLVYQIGSKKGSPRGRRPRGERKLGEKYHDFCFCTAKAIPVGADVMEVLYLEDPEYATTVDVWNTEYNKARDNSGSTDPKKILAEWRTFGDDIA
jgi:hypothetical protein